MSVRIQPFPYYDSERGRNSRGIVTPDTPSPRSPADPVVPALPDASTDERRRNSVWPVPQVIVVYRGPGTRGSCAFGRQAVINAGKDEFMIWLFEAFVWARPKPTTVFDKTHYDATFPARYTLFANFYNTGTESLGHSELVKIGRYGWEEMVQNVFRFELVCDE